MKTYICESDTDTGHCLLAPCKVTVAYEYVRAKYCVYDGQRCQWKPEKIKKRKGGKK
jgi:hypothetical protein